jgi:hypothetical protein
MTRILKALRQAGGSLGSDLIVKGWVRATNATRWDARPTGEKLTRRGYSQSTDPRWLDV